MERAEAAGLLHVPVDASPAEARAAYRRLIRVHHPDTAGAGSTAAAARIITAWEVLRGAPPEATRLDPGPVDPAPDTEAKAAVGAEAEAATVTVHGDTLAIALTAEEAFLLLLEGADDLGEVVYVDPDAGLLETIVTFEDGPTCSLVISLQGRAEHVDAFCTVEPLTGGPVPSGPAVAALVARTARRRLSRP